MGVEGDWEREGGKRGAARLCVCVCVNAGGGGGGRMRYL